MSETVSGLTPADPCPACGDDFVAHRAATPDEFAAFTHKETPTALPPRVDSASPEQRAKLGALYVCKGCGYQTRVKDDADAARAADAAPDAGKAPTSRRARTSTGD